MASRSLTIKMHISGVRETVRAFGDLPDDATHELRDRTKELSEDLARSISTAARSDSPQSALIAPTVKAVRDRVPAVQAGGAKRVGSNRKPAYKILFGSEFGSNALKQYRPHRGSASYWFFRTVEDNEQRIGDTWTGVADEVLRKWANV